MTSFYNFSARTIDGDTVDLKAYADRVLLIVNVASECGFTSQYAGLQALHKHYHKQGFAVLGFPCNQFGAQEPGDADSISRFCTTKYTVTFPMFDKIDVNGPNAIELYRWLKAQKSGILGSSSIKWNFTKFLVGRDGQVLARYGPTTKPEALANAIEIALAAN